MNGVPGVGIECVEYRSLGSPESGDGTFNAEGQYGCVLFALKGDDGDAGQAGNTEGIAVTGHGLNRSKEFWVLRGPLST